MQFEAILFDCDGVLVDSEPITNGVLRDMLEESGWTLTPDECQRLFVGKTLREERATVEARTGRPLTDAWLQLFYQRRNRELDARVEVIAGAHAAVPRRTPTRSNASPARRARTVSRWRCSCSRWA